MSTYGLWQHEIGTDEIDGSDVNAIYSYFVTGLFSLLKNGVDKNVSTLKIELDLVQTGEMTVQVVGSNGSRGAQVESDRYPFDPDTVLAHPKATRRFMQLKFESNTPGGNYLIGTPIIHVGPSDGRSAP